MPPIPKSVRYIQRLLLALLMLLLVFPAVQAKWPLVPLRPLSGVTNAVSSPHFTWDDLWHSRFQPALEAYLTERLGFKPWLVRIRNQMAYSLWHKTLTAGVILGKNDNLYQENSIQAYLGYSYQGEAELAKRAQQLRQVQDTLRAHGTQLLFVLAPGKPRIVPDYLPERYTSEQKNISNYETISQQFTKHGVNTLDAAALLLSWQAAKPPYPLYTRTGTHWSGYAVTRVADTLFHRIEYLTGRDLPDFGPKGPPTVVTSAADVRYSDKDLGDLLNLIQDIKPYPTAYPNIVFGPTQGKQRVNAIVIGDSFTQGFYTFYPYFDKLLTPESRFWYYNGAVYWPEQTPPGENRNVRELNLAEQLRGRDIVVILTLEGNLTNTGFGFIDAAYNLYCKPAQ